MLKSRLFDFPREKNHKIRISSNHFLTYTDKKSFNAFGICATKWIFHRNLTPVSFKMTYHKLRCNIARLILKEDFINPANVESNNEKTGQRWEYDQRCRIYPTFTFKTQTPKSSSFKKFSTPAPKVRVTENWKRKNLPSNLKVTALSAPPIPNIGHFRNFEFFWRFPRFSTFTCPKKKDSRKKPSIHAQRTRIFFPKSRSNECLAKKKGVLTTTGLEFFFSLFAARSYVFRKKGA